LLIKGAELVSNDKERTAEWCMVYELINGSLDNISGTVDIE
jgi:hypothetical protein